MSRASGTLIIAALLAATWPAGARATSEITSRPPSVPAPAPTTAAPEVPSAPAPEPPPPPPPPPPAQDDTWIDAGHSILSEGIFWPVARFDRFFADEREVEASRARSFVRWRNDVRTGTDDRLRLGTSLRADLRFPNLSRRLERLRLTLASDTADALDVLSPNDQPAPGNAGRVSAGLRLDLLESAWSQSDLQGGLLFQLPVGAYLRARFRHVQPVDGLFQVRTSSAGFWQTNTGWGVRQDLDLERPFGAALLLRLANFATLTQKSRGLEWASELSLSRAFGERAAVALIGSGTGSSDAGLVVERWRVATRLRHEAFRRWIFLEVEPEGVWIRPLGGGRQRVLAVIFRLEVQFDGTAHLPPVGARRGGP